MATIASLVVSVSANTAKFSRDMKGANRNVKELGGAADTASSKIGMLGKGLVAGLGVGTGIGIIRRLTGEFAEWRAEIDATAKAALSLGTTYSNLRQLRFAGAISGAGEEAVTKSLLKLQQTIGRALREPKGTEAGYLDELKLSATELAAMDPADALEKFAAALQEVPTDAQRTAVAMDVLGRGAREMMVLLNEGSGGIRALRDEQKRLRGSTAGTVQAVQDYNDAMTRSREVWAGVKDLYFGAPFFFLETTKSVLGLKQAKEEVTKATAAELNAEILLREERAKAAKQREADIALAGKNKASIEKTTQVYLDELERIRDGIDPLDQQVRHFLEGMGEEGKLPDESLIPYRDRLLEIVEALKAARKAQEETNKAALDAEKAAKRAAGGDREKRALIDSLRESYEVFRDELFDIEDLKDRVGLDERTVQMAKERAAAKYLGGMPEYREPVLIGSAARGSAAAYESMVKAQSRTEMPEDKIRVAVEKALLEAVKQTQLLAQIEEKTQPAKIA
ncbi:MAG TPA: hypothetical protein VNA25_01685, partial [Phycisphaerae bacterium]|nr:hypothetical protein [Phycisphaerae bacterium]